MSRTVIEIKNNIARDWLDTFPLLSKFAINKFYRILGPLVTGIELTKLPWSPEYRPHFVVYGLWDNAYGKWSESPFVLNQLFDERGFQMNIAYENHGVI